MGEGKSGLGVVLHHTHAGPCVNNTRTAMRMRMRMRMDCAACAEDDG